MNNNDILIRLRYALDIKEIDMVEMFKTGGIALSRADVKERLVKSQEFSTDESATSGDNSLPSQTIECSCSELAGFLSGLIISKRGKQEPNPDQPAKPELVATHHNINNILLKKVKIALELSSDDMLDIFDSADVMITKGELSALFRNQGHRNYKECGDKFARKFLKGLAIKYRA